MKAESIELLRAPGSSFPLHLHQVTDGESEEIKPGELMAADSQIYPIKNFIPRFVLYDSYTASFGEQWNRYRGTQIDKFNGTTLSRDRFFSSTNWSEAELKGQRVLEVGCGAGRFTQVLLDAGAHLCSMDYSSAVDACWANNG